MIKHADPAYAAERLPPVLAACGERRRIAIDGGAFVGSWTRNLSEHFARVIAFEPIPKNFDQLAANAARPGVDLHQYALSDRAGTMIARPGRGGTDYGWQMVESRAGDIVAIALDGLNLQDVDFIKLDVEGNEYRALQGARRTIKRCRPVVLIEEKFDKQKRATALLIKLGMKLTHSMGRDHLFTWE